MQQQLSDNIFGKQNRSTDIQILNELTEQYPYFGLPYFYLLKQSQPGNNDYPVLTAKTALHFAHPYLLQYRLQNSETPSSPEIIQDIEIEQKVESHLSVEIPVSIKIPLPKIDTSQTEELIFQPLYTSDYFASQGIKLSDQPAGTDKLSIQVKSFTDWLKTMKKLPGSHPPVAENIDGTVQQLAEKSNTETEVITESMAEVYITQDKPRKAIEIYEKLSLLNPAKSAFFAAKIESIKRSENN